MKELLDDIKKIFSKKLTLAVVLVIVAALAISADTASEVRQMPERCLSRKAGIVRCCHKIKIHPWES